jgi:hypothetical protein
MYLGGSAKYILKQPIDFLRRFGLRPLHQMGVGICCDLVVTVAQSFLDDLHRHASRNHQARLSVSQIMEREVVRNASGFPNRMADVPIEV